LKIKVSYHLPLKVTDLVLLVLLTISGETDFSNNEFDQKKNQKEGLG
jgi:hypothetical protein